MKETIFTKHTLLVRHCRTLLLVLATALCANVSSGKESAKRSSKESNDLMRANYYYSHFAFHEAIPFFEKLATTETSSVTYGKLGDCYRMTADPDKAADAYAKAVQIKGCKDVIMLHYGRVLMTLMKYDEAQKWLKEYQKTNKTDKRAANLIAGCATASKLLNAEPPGRAILQGFNTSGSDFAPTTWNGHLVFASNTAINLKKKTDKWTGGSFYNIYLVNCDAKGNCADEIKTFEQTKSLNIKYHDGPCTFSADGTKMYFTRSRYSDNFFSKQAVSNSEGTVVLEAMIASDYDTAENRFKDISPFKFNSKEHSVAYPTVSPNGNTIVFASIMRGGAGGSDLYVCRKKGKSDWTKPENIGRAINTEGEEVFPYFADDNTLYFSSDGHEGLGGLDVYMSKWDEKTQSFSKPTNVGIPINSSYDDISMALYPDGRSAYFSSNRPASKTGDNIYFFKREKAFLELKVTDSASGQPLADVEADLASDKDKRTLGVDNNGTLITRLFPGTQYKIDVSKPGYINRQLDVSTYSIGDKDTIVQQVSLARLVVAAEVLPVAEIAEQSVEKNQRFDAPEVKEFEMSKVYEIDHFNYDLNEYGLNSVKKIVLDSLVNVLKRRPTMEIQVQAHTDCRGTAEYNLKLSKARAAAVIKYLAEKGIAPKRLKSKGLGYTAPAVKCPDCAKCTEEDHFQNRILEFKVIGL
jgi:outer membrane protein OmpA-like peptidoglycan-associated protein/tetratricopeptide (TPR) repeat protein